MNRIGKICLGALGLIGMTIFAHAMVAKYNAYLANEAGLTFNKTYPLPLNSYGIDYLSFTTTASSVTFANSTFTDGQQSTGSVTVTTTSGLGAVAATNSLTVETTTIPSGSILTVNGIPIILSNYADITTTATAINIKQAVNLAVSNITASTASSSVINFTAVQTGSYGNNMVLSANVSTQTILINGGTTANNSSNFTGGKDSARLTINGINIPFTTLTGVGGSSTTATSIVKSINTNALLNTIIVATNNTTGTTVIATSTVAGAFTNYIITSSTDSSLTINGTTKTVTGLNGASIGQMWGGKDPSFFLNQGSTTVVNITNHGYTLALPVLYSTGAFAITGLTNLTTYYVIPITSNALSLSATSTGAVAGLAIPLTSSRTTTSADTYTLAPLAITGTPSYRWEVSNDALTWQPLTATIANVTVSSVTLAAYTSTGTVNTWDFGPIDYAFLRLSVVSPLTGAIKIQASGNGKTEGQFQ